MSTQNRVFSRLFDADKRRQNLSKQQKVALGLVDSFNYDFSSLQDQEGLLSYLAYEWHDEKFEEYRQAWMTLNDEYKHNGSSVLRYDDVSGDVDILNEIKVKAEELGLDANDVYDQWDDHMQALESIKEADDQYQRNEQQFNDWS
jgi:hypothetical protein